MRIKKFLCYALCLALSANSAFVMTGCDDGEEDDFFDLEDEEEDEDESVDAQTGKSGDNGSWTILCYLCGTDLESEGGAGTLNLEEIMDADLSDDINFVVETGGTSEWETDDIDPDILGRYLIRNNELELVDEQSLSNMSDVETFSDFLQWGVSEYPADKYMIIVWDHGCGSVDGVIYDELFIDENDEDYDLLSVKDIAQGIESTNQTFELVGFDACLMSSLEQAAAICPYANYMVASEETEPGGGWNYTEWLNTLSKDTSMDGASLGTVIVDSFYEKCEEEGEETDCTLSVTDLSKIPALVESFNKMAEEMKGCSNDVSDIKVITGAFKSSQGFGGNNRDEGYTDMVDLGDLALNAQGVLNDTAEQVIDDLLAAVVYKKNGSARYRSEGLSVYVPLSKDEDRFEKYAKNAAVSGDYLRFLEELYDFDSPSDVEIVVPTIAGNDEVVTESFQESEYEPAEKIENRDQKIEHTLRVNDDGYVEADITAGSDIIDAVRCNLYCYDEDEDEYYYMGSDYNVTVNDDWTVFEDNFDNTWVCIEDCVCMINPVSISDDVIEYYVPVYVNGDRSNLRIIWSFDKEEFEILGLWDGVDENGIPSRDFRKLKKGDQVDFVFQVLDSEMENAEEVCVEGFVVQNDVSIAEEELEDGSYVYRFSFDDIFGGTTDSEPAYFFVEDGEIYTEL